jgi:hypothetical protein
MFMVLKMLFQRLFLGFFFVQLSMTCFAQSNNCTVSGVIHKFDGSPAVNTEVDIVKIEQNGIQLQSPPFSVVSDGNGVVSFSVPRPSEAWVQANGVSGLNTAGGVPLSIPDAPTAALELLWHLSDGVLSLNGRQGDITLTSSDVTSALGYAPLSPTSVIAAINASTESVRISDAQLSARVVRLNSFQSGNISIQNTDPTTPVQVLRGAAGQGANLQEWQDSTGRPVAAITRSGQINLPATAPGKAPFVIDFRNLSFGGVPDPSFYVGYNQAANGSKIQQGENSLSWAVEGDYNDGTPNHKMETYIQYTSASGGSLTRPIFFQFDRTTDQLTASQIQGNPFQILMPDGVTKIADFYPANVMIAGLSGRDSSLTLSASSGRTSVLQLGYDTNDARLQIIPGSNTASIKLSGTPVATLYDTPIGVPGAAMSIGANDNSAVGVFAVGSSHQLVKGLVARGRAGQRGDLQEWQNSDRTPLSVVDPNGSFGIGTNTISTDAVLDINGGDAKGLRIRPRSTTGAPTTGTWNPGTIIVDNQGALYVCVIAGTPGIWNKVGSQ